MQTWVCAEIAHRACATAAAEPDGGGGGGGGGGCGGSAATSGGEVATGAGGGPGRPRGRAGARTKQTSDVVTGSKRQVNLVSTVGLGVESINLPRLTMLMHGARHAQDFQSTTLRPTKPRMTWIIFGTARVVGTGARSVTDSRVGLRQLVVALREHGIPARFEWWRQSTRVLAGSLSHPIKLNELRSYLREKLHATVLVKKFPGLIAVNVPVGRDVAPNGAGFTVFRSGNVIITGVDSAEHGSALWERIFRILARFADHRNSSRSTAQYQAVSRIRDGLYSAAGDGAAGAGAGTPVPRKRRPRESAGAPRKRRAPGSPGDPEAVPPPQKSGL